MWKFDYDLFTNFLGGKMPYTDEMLYNMELEYERAHDHDAGIFDGMDDRFDDPMPEPDSEELIIDGLRKKGIHVGSLYDDPISNDEDFDLMLAEEMHYFEDFVSKREASLLLIQQNLERAEFNRQKKINKEKCWRPKKN